MCSQTWGYTCDRAVKDRAKRKYKISGKWQCPLTDFRQNENLTNSLDAAVQNTDKILPPSLKLVLNVNVLDCM